MRILKKDWDNHFCRGGYSDFGTCSNGLRCCAPCTKACVRRETKYSSGTVDTQCINLGGQECNLI